MAITKRGLGWELLQSAWVLVPPASVGMLVWAAFLYAGIRARHRPWLVAAAVYFLGFVSALALTDDSDNWTGLIIVALWFVGTVHAFIVRPEYLIRLDADLSADAARSSPAPRTRRVVPVDATFAPFTRPAAPSLSAAPVSSTAPASAPQPSAPVDLNAAPEAAIAALPGIGPILARRAVEVRDARGGFASVDDFADALDLKPHVLERIRPLAFTTPLTARPRPMGRRVDY
jgi:hypothetical protein